MVETLNDVLFGNIIEIFSENKLHATEIYD